MHTTKLTSVFICCTAFQNVILRRSGASAEHDSKIKKRYVSSFANVIINYWYALFGNPAVSQLLIPEGAVTEDF